MAELPVDRQLEVVSAAGEVVLQLASLLVEPGRGLEDPRRDPPGEVGEQLVGILVRQAEPHQTLRRLASSRVPKGESAVA